MHSIHVLQNKAAKLVMDRPTLSSSTEALLDPINQAPVVQRLDNAIHRINHYPVDNRPRSIYQYSNMAPRLSGQNSIFGVVFFVSKSLLGIERQKKLEKFAILTRKPRSHARILIYRTWPIVNKTNHAIRWIAIYPVDSVIQQQPGPEE